MLHVKMLQLLPPTKEEVNAFACVCLERPHISPSLSEASVRKIPSDISRQSFIVVEFRIFVCLSVSKISKDLDDMLRVDICWDMD